MHLVKTENLDDDQVFCSLLDPFVCRRRVRRDYKSLPEA